MHVTFEEGTSAAWLYTLLKPHAFADRCRHERRVAEDSSAAIRRVWAIPCGGQEVHPRDIFGDRQYLRAIYSPRHRAEWLGKITEASVRRRAELLHRQAKKELLAEGRKHKATKLLRQIPSIGPIRSVLLVALLQTPHRFRTKRQLWTYSGLALETRNSGEYRFQGGQLKRSKKVFAIRGLNKNHNHDLKNAHDVIFTNHSQPCLGLVKKAFDCWYSSNEGAALSSLHFRRAVRGTPTAFFDFPPMGRGMDSNG